MTGKSLALCQAESLTYFSDRGSAASDDIVVKPGLLSGFPAGGEDRKLTNEPEVEKTGP